MAYVDSATQRVFEDIDTDGSGKLSQRELSRALQQLGVQARSERELHATMEKYDRDGDGYLNVYEFSQMVDHLRNPSAPRTAHRPAMPPGGQYYKRDQAMNGDHRRPPPLAPHAGGPRSRRTESHGEGIFVSAGRLTVEPALRRHDWLQEVWVDIDVIGLEAAQACETPRATTIADAADAAAAAVDTTTVADTTTSSTTADAAAAATTTTTTTLSLSHPLSHTPALRRRPTRAASTPRTTTTSTSTSRTPSPRRTAPPVHLIPISS